jgi:hypothetical protein
MRWSWLLHLWPGLGRLWYRGELSGLTLALLFCVLFNFAVATSFVWTELVTNEVRAALWITVAFLWIGSLVAGATRGTRNWHAPNARAEDLFLAANGEYLRGCFGESAAILERMIRRNPRDVEARLLLATIRRQENRWEEAKVQLRYLQRVEAAASWRWEIEHEWSRIRHQEGERGEIDAAA